MGTELSICRDCLELRGALPDGRVQRCRCESRGSLKEKRWPGYDFNVSFELCYFCAAEAIPSGSRWSSFYCDGCREHAEKRELPLGRHALLGSGIDRLRVWRRDRVRAILRGLPGVTVPLARYLAHARGFAATQLFDGHLAEAATSSSRRA